MPGNMNEIVFPNHNRKFYTLPFDLDRENKAITTARKSIFTLVKLHILLYYVQKFAPLLSRKWCKFLHIIQKYTKFAKFAGLYFPHFTTFRDQTLQF